MTLPPSFFDHLEDRLNLAVFDINMDFRAKIRDALEGKKAKSGTDAMGNPFVDLPGKHVLVSPDDTVEEIARKIGTSRMSITGLQSGAFQAQISAMRQRLIEKQAAGGAKIVAAGEAAGAKIDDAVNSAEAKIDKEVADVLQDFSDFTNGGPA